MNSVNILLIIMFLNILFMSKDMIKVVILYLNVKVIFALKIQRIKRGISYRGTIFLDIQGLLIPLTIIFVLVPLMV